ncbi:TRAP transporter small permease [Cohnella pontilimi]|uniref:TRAP transporter small permease n=1 Tax=Cohnella pontilimi TaxID=2564100 RepID=A0A4U0F5F0_9BACL|nr:TRAP transporter small permease [Cohnella pontilimi]TJY39845.1 TRAP transporter small permease [Cohnella pontilimi]
MNKLINKITAFLNFLLAVCLSLMIIFVFGNVVLRYAFDSGITWSEEVSRFLFIWSILIGSILALKDNEHLGVDSLIKKLSITGKKIVYVISNLMILATMVLVFIGCWKLTILNVDQSAPATGMPYAYIYAVGCLMCACMVLIVFARLYRVLAGKMEEREFIMTTDSDELVQQNETDNDNHEEGAKKS